MPYNAYPTDAELKTRLVAMGMFSDPPTQQQNTFNLTSAVQAAVDQFEPMVGYEPFLVQGGQQTYYFDADGAMTIDFLGGFVSISSVALNGTQRTENYDYNLYPRNALTQGKPYNYMKWRGFWRPQYTAFGQPAPIAVTGLRGYCAQLPDLAWEAVMALAVKFMVAQASFLLVGGVKSWKAGTDEEEYNPKPFADIIEGCNSTVSAAVQSFGRRKIA